MHMGHFGDIHAERSPLNCSRNKTLRMERRGVRGNRIERQRARGHTHTAEGERGREGGREGGLTAYIRVTLERPMLRGLR